MSLLRIEREEWTYRWKVVVACCLEWLGLVALCRYLNRHQVKILMYHGVIDRALPTPLNAGGLHIPLHQFERQIAFCARNYHMVSLNTFLDHLEHRAPLPPYCLIVTFDDGYLNNYQNAFPVLQRYRVPATFFVTTSFISSNTLMWRDQVDCLIHATAQASLTMNFNGGLPETFALATQADKRSAVARLRRRLQDLPEEERGRLLALTQEQLRPSPVLQDTSYCSPLNWEHLKAMATDGFMELGSHAVHHIELNTLDGTRVSEELALSKTTIEAMAGTHVTAFAYPAGGFTNAVKEAVHRTGYRCGLSTIHGFNDVSTDLFELRRNEVGNRGNLILFRAMVSGVLDVLKAGLGLVQRR